MASQPYSHRRETSKRAPILERVLHSERARLLRHAHFHSERSQDVEDALADACVQFLRHYGGPAEMEDALRWMLLVVKRCAWEIARRRRRRGGDRSSIPSEVVEDALVAEPRGGPAERVERTEETEQALAAIGRLAPDERTALILFGMGCSYGEIACMRGWSVAKVNRRLNEGRARVRRMLKKRGESS
jgi:RNA polymerase sigma factor (sigma-70 family)